MTRRSALSSLLVSGLVRFLLASVAVGAVRSALAADSPALAAARRSRPLAERVLVVRSECGRLFGKERRIGSGDVRRMGLEDGTSHPRCAEPHAQAFTPTGSTSVQVCPGFAALPEAAQVVVLLHEAYHTTTGMTDEDGGGSDAITRAVLTCLK